MAALTPRPTNDGALELASSWGSRLRGFGTIQIVIIFILASVLFGGGGSDPSWIIFLLALSFIPSLANLLGTTTVRIEPTARRITRATRLLTLSLSSQTLDLNAIQKIRVQYGGRGIIASRANPLWQLVAVPEQGKSLIINSNGTWNEMNALAQQVVKLTNLPLEDTASTPNALTEVMQTIGETLALPTTVSGTPSPTPATANVDEDDSDATEETEATPAPNTLMPDSPSPEHAEFERDARLGETTGDADSLTEEEKEVPPNTLPLDSPSPVHAQFETDAQTTAESAAAASPQPAARFAQMSLNDLLQAVRADPTQSDAWFELARRYASSRQWKPMADALRQVLKFDPLNPDAQNDLGVALLQMGALSDAETALNRAIALDPFGMRARVNLALALMRHGQDVKAQGILDDARQYANDDSQTRLLDAVRRGALKEPLRSGS